jgi:hypothetical protein
MSMRDELKALAKDWEELEDSHNPSSFDMGFNDARREDGRQLRAILSKPEEPLPGSAIWRSATSWFSSPPTYLTSSARTEGLREAMISLIYEIEKDREREPLTEYMKGAVAESLAIARKLHSALAANPPQGEKK